MARFVLLDFETASGCDLKKSGAWRYAEDFTTEILCLGFSIDGGEPEILTANQLGWGYHTALSEAVVDEKCIFIAFNTGFEKAIWRHLMSQRGWPEVPNERWHDPQAVCAMKSIPPKLANALRVLGLGTKDTEGTKTVLTFSKIDKKTGKLGGSDETRQARLERTYTYCRSDVAEELALHRRVKSLGVIERPVWLLDQTINERGVRLDRNFIAAAQAICDQAAGPLVKEFGELTGLKPSQGKEVLKWVNAKGANLPNLQKETIDKFLGIPDDEDDDDLSGELAYDEEQVALPFLYRRPLEIRRILGSASIKKLGSMRACVGFDGRARGLIQYHGAGPGRWSGRLLQPQNFPRPTLKLQTSWDKEGNPINDGHDPEQLVDAIKTGDAEYVRCIFGEPIEAVASSLRHAIIASDGNELVVGDFQTIEARVVLALAGQYDKCKMIADGADIYVAMARDIYDMKVDPYDKAQVKAFKAAHPEKRQTGKNSVLGCGFQMGKAKFKLRYAPDKPLEFAESCVNAYRKDFAPLVPDLWYGMEEAATRCVWDRRSTEHAGFVYQLEDGWLTCRLPSGRKLWYYDPRPVRKAMPWDKDDIRPGVEYSSWKLGQWMRITGYGGKWTQNVVEGVARDLLVEATKKCEVNGLPVILLVHDEDVCDAPIRPDNKKLLEQIMCDRPEWARQLQIPVGSDVWIGDRYRK